MTEAVYDTLPSALQKRFDSDADALFAVHKGFAKRLAKSYPNQSSFVRSAVFADLAKRQSIRGLAERTNLDARTLKLSTSLLRGASRDFHYQNNPLAFSWLSRLSLCFNIEAGRLVQAALAFDKSYRAVASDAGNTDAQLELSKRYAVQRRDALIRAFLVHLLQDAAQPLHQFTAITHFCQHDRGGNESCYKRSDSGNECKQNLHARWDYLSSRVLRNWKNEYGKSQADTIRPITMNQILQTYERRSRKTAEQSYEHELSDGEVTSEQLQALTTAANLLRQYLLSIHIAD